MEEFNFQWDPQVGVYRYTGIDVEMQVSKSDLSFGVPYLHVEHGFVPRGQAYPHKTAPRLGCEALRIGLHTQLEDRTKGVWFKRGMKMNIHPQRQRGRWTGDEVEIDSHDSRRGGIGVGVCDADAVER